MSDAALIALPGAEEDASRLAARLQLPQLDLEARRFPDGERYLRVIGDVSDRRVIVTARLSPPDEAAMGLLFLADALRDLGARHVTLVLPYLPYLRQDARFKPGEAVTSRTFARLLSGVADELVTVDPHLHRYPTLEAVYGIPGRVVRSATAIAGWLRAHVDDPMLVGPDQESEQWVADVASRVGCPYQVLVKDRRGDRDVSVSPARAGVQRGTAVLLDDILSTGRTLAEAVGSLRRAGWNAVRCVVVHDLGLQGAHETVMSAGAADIVSCNTLPCGRPQIDVWDDIAGALG
jgi:ribose-phosphate pyrophosphokinase